MKCEGSGPDRDPVHCHQDMREFGPGEGQDLQFILTEEGDRSSLS